MYATDQEMYEALSVPFPTAFIRWRVGNINSGGALPLCYVDARAVMDRLDSVCGMGGWQRLYPTSGNPNLMVCNLGIRLPAGEWVWKSDAAGPTDFEGEKGMSSDALKRAAVNFGVGRYLYDLKCERMQIDGKTFSKEETKELNRLHDEKIQEWGWDTGFRPGAYLYRMVIATIRSFVTSPHQAIEWQEQNAGLLASIPVRARNSIKEELAKVGATEVAA